MKDRVLLVDYVALSNEIVVDSRRLTHAQVKFLNTVYGSYQFNSWWYELFVTRQQTISKQNSNLYIYIR